jgi:hypothetical protein
MMLVRARPGHLDYLFKISTIKHFSTARATSTVKASRAQVSIYNTVRACNGKTTIINRGIFNGCGSPSGLFLFYWHSSYFYLYFSYWMDFMFGIFQPFIGGCMFSGST